MIRQYVSGRIAVYIDAANILYSQQSLGWRIDYAKLQIYFRSQCNLQSIHFYTGKVSSNSGERRFHEKLRRLGYEITAKEVKKIRTKDGSVILKGNLDIELAVDVLSTLDSFDTLVLMSGDGDFASLLDVARRKGKQVLVMSTKGHIARELLQRAKYFNLKKLKNDIAWE